MGYVLDIELWDGKDKGKGIFYGGKFYGYIDDEKVNNLASLKYLQEITGNYEYQHFCYYDCDPFGKELLLTQNQAIKFAELYLKEMLNYWNFAKEEKKYFLKDLRKLKYKKYKDNIFYVNWG